MGSYGKPIRTIIYGILLNVHISEAAVTERGIAPGFGDCAPHPLGFAPLSDAHSLSAFTANPEYSSFADKAPTPGGYVKIFQDYNSTVKSPFYLDVHSLIDYDPLACADFCAGRLECKAFNTYVERFPTLDPGPACPNPPATAHFRCALYGEAVQGEQAVNYGELQPPADKNGEQFAVAIRGSNAYNKAPEDYNNGPSVTFVQRVYATDGVEVPTETVTTTVFITKTRKVKGLGHHITRTVTSCPTTTQEVVQHTL